MHCKFSIKASNNVFWWWLVYILVFIFFSLFCIFRGNAPLKRLRSGTCLAS